MSRALLSPIIDACIAIAKSTSVPVGDGEAPDCEKPYIVVNAVSSPPYKGPLPDGEADSVDRIQFSCIGETRAQADAVRDDLRAAMTYAALDAQFVTLSANRRMMHLKLDINRGGQRDDRGLPAPIFSAIDQYIIETTPT